MREIKFAEKQFVMIGGIASAAMKIGSGIFGGIKAVKEAKKQKEMVEQSKRENEAWFNRRYNEDATQRADAQRMLTYVNDSIKGRTAQLRGRLPLQEAQQKRLRLKKRHLMQLCRQLRQTSPRRRKLGKTQSSSSIRRTRRTTTNSCETSAKTRLTRLRRQSAGCRLLLTSLEA